MPFFQVDDQLTQNRKARRLLESAMDGQLAGIGALGLWVAAGSQAQTIGGGTDGVVSRADLVRLVLNPAVADLLAAELVEVGLWHTAGHDCDRCPEVPDGSWIFHDWFDMGYTRAGQVLVNRRKRQELKDPLLVAQVWARDCLDPADPTVGACRYCGTHLKRKDTRSRRRPHLDHVDPRKAAGIRNVVLACDECNRAKGNRTPQEAGMTLQPPPRPDQSWSVAGPGTQAADDAGPPAGSSRCSETAALPSATETANQEQGSRAARSQVDDDAGSSAGSSRDATAAHLDDRTLDQPLRRVEDVAGPPAPGSPRPGRDRRTHDAPRPTTGRPPPDQTRTTPRPDPDQAGRGVPGGRGPGQGQGQGQGLGSGQGEAGVTRSPASPEPSKTRSRRRRRRPRSRARRDPDVVTTGSSWDAGDAPAGVLPPGDGFGSPWAGWHGPPSPVVETDCATHHLPDPCWKCGRDNRTEDA